MKRRRLSYYQNKEYKKLYKGYTGKNTKEDRISEEEIQEIMKIAAIDFKENFQNNIE